MNKHHLSRSLYKRFRVNPIAKRIGADGVEHPRIDDVWLVTDASREHLVLRNPRSDQHVTLRTAHVHHHAPDNGRSDGILNLKSQISLFAPAGFAVEPLRKR
jgi:hypothetical protein